MPILRRTSLFFALSITCAVLAQTPKFIEISVSDTLYLEPTSITYTVKAGEEKSFMGMKMPSFGDEADSSKPSVSMDATMAKLKAAKFNVAWSTDNSYDLSKETRGKRDLEVKVLNRAELDRLLNELRSIEGISGSITDVQHASPDPAQGTFYAGLIAKARREAGAIAAASGLKLGPVSSVGERPSLTDGYTDIMRTVMKKSPFTAMMGSEADLTGIYVRTLLIRFEAN